MTTMSATTIISTPNHNNRRQRQSYPCTPDQPLPQTSPLLMGWPVAGALIDRTTPRWEKSLGKGASEVEEIVIKASGGPAT